MRWRAFDKSVRRKPLAFAVDAVYGNSIDLELEVFAKKNLALKALLSMFRQCTAPRIHAGTPRVFFFQAKIRLQLYTRQRSQRKRLRSDGQTGK